MHLNNLQMGSVLFCFLMVLQKAYPDSEMSRTRLVIAGADPSTEVTKVLAKEFCRSHPAYEITVPEKSIKHAGGIRWVAEYGQPLGRLGRPLSEKDLQAFPSVRSLPMARVQIAFAVHRNLGVSTLSLEDWRSIVTGRTTNWKEVGGPDAPIIMLGREKTEATQQAICKAYPFFKDAVFKKKYLKDHLMVSAIEEVPHAIGFATSHSLSARSNLVILAIEGFTCGQPLGLAYDARNDGAPLIAAMKNFLAGDQWQVALHEHGFLGICEGHWITHFPRDKSADIGKAVNALRKTAECALVRDALRCTFHGFDGDKQCCPQAAYTMEQDMEAVVDRSLQGAMKDSLNDLLNEVVTRHGGSLSWAVIFSRNARPMAAFRLPRQAAAALENRSISELAKENIVVLPSLIGDAAWTRSVVLSIPIREAGSSVGVLLALVKY